MQLPEPFFYGECVGLLWVGADSDIEAIEYFKPSLDHPEVAIGEGVERPGIDCGAHWIVGRVSFFVVPLVVLVMMEFFHLPRSCVS